MTPALIKARAYVHEAQKWLDACDIDIAYPGEEDDALRAYCEAASAFIELYDEMMQEKAK